MCGRYTLTRSEEHELAERFSISEFSETRLVPRFNIAPSQDVSVILKQGDHNVMTLFQWGLIPSWAKDLKKTKPMINARIESIAEKPFFKSAIKNRRCLIPADGFFEWQVDPHSGQKIPTYIHFAGRPLFAFAGLWDQCTSPDGEVIRTCSIITTPANSFMESIHNRMPAILPVSNEAKWLNPAETDVSSLLALLHSPGVNELASYPVSRLVNSPRVDDAECVSEVASATALNC